MSATNGALAVVDISEDTSRPMAMFEEMAFSARPIHQHVRALISTGMFKSMWTCSP
jgi:hypothetical protein